MRFQFSKMLTAFTYVILIIIQELLSAIREELLWAKRVPCERLEAPYEAYRLDYTQFKTLFTALSPWAKGDFAEAITARMFKVRYLIGFLRPPY